MWQHRPVDDPLSVRSGARGSVPEPVTRKFVQDAWHNWGAAASTSVGIELHLAFYTHLIAEHPRLLKTGNFGGRNRFTAIRDWVVETAAV